MQQNNEFVEIIKNYIKSKLKGKNSDEEFDLHDYEAWLDTAAIYSESIAITTHPAKFTSGEIKWNVKKESANILIKKDSIFKKNPNFFVTTFNLDKLDLDVHCNAAYLGYGAFFLLRNPENNNHLIEEILSGNTTFLFAFTKNEKKVEEWIESFTATTIPKKYVTSGLAKQVYFPISEDTYHIVNPLTASSLYQKVYNKIKTIRYGKFYKDLRAKKKKNEFSHDLLIEYPNTALTNFGGSQPQNTSYLNSKRNGEMFLLCCKPPIWKTTKGRKTIDFKTFWEEFENLNKKQIYKIKHFLISSWKNNSEARQQRATLFSTIYENFIFFICSVRNDKEKYEIASIENLSFLQVFLLANTKNDFENEIQNDVDKIADYFSKFILNHLSHKKIEFKEDEFYQVKKEIKTEIKELVRTLL